MKKSMRKLVIVATMLMLTLGCSITTQAKAKKLKVDTVYTITKSVKGTTTLKKAKVVAKIGKKTYNAKSNNKGNFTIKIATQKKGTKVKVIVYKGKQKVYAKKTIKVKEQPKLIINNNTLATDSVIKGRVKLKKTEKAEININLQTIKGAVKFNINGANGGYFSSDYLQHSGTAAYPGTTVTITVYKYTKNSKNAIIKKLYAKKTMKITKDNTYVYSDGYGSYMTIKGGPGITIYYTMYTGKGKGQTVKPTNFSAPTLKKYDGVIKPGEELYKEGTEFKKGELQDDLIYLKYLVYKNGKKVKSASTWDALYLLQGRGQWQDIAEDAKGKIYYLHDEYSYIELNDGRWIRCKELKILDDTTILWEKTGEKITKEQVCGSQSMKDKNKSYVKAIYKWYGANWS